MKKTPIIRWMLNRAAYLICVFIILLYATIIYGSFSTAWGVDFTPTLKHWSTIITRGVEAILDTTFLSALATPFAAILGMIIAWLVVRKKFTGKAALDFSSNLGGAVPGTILGIGFVMAFNKPPLALAIAIYAVVGVVLRTGGRKKCRERIIIPLGTASGVALTKLIPSRCFPWRGMYFLMAAILMITQENLLFIRRLDRCLYDVHQLGVANIKTDC